MCVLLCVNWAAVCSRFDMLTDDRFIALGRALLSCSRITGSQPNWITAKVQKQFCAVSVLYPAIIYCCYQGLLPAARR